MEFLYHRIWSNYWNWMGSIIGDWMVLGGGPLSAMLAFAIELYSYYLCELFLSTNSSNSYIGGELLNTERTFGKNVSSITGWLLALGNGILCPWEAIAISTLVSDMFGDLIPFLRSVKLYSILGADIYLFPTIIALDLHFMLLCSTSKELNQLLSCKHL